MTMIKLSKRMQMNVDLIDCEAVADIGCDHAYVSIYLLQSGKAKKVIAMDVRQGPLEMANQNIKLYGYENEIEPRLSDGFEALQVGEAECAIIAGMGGSLMVDILKRGANHTDAGIHLVLQPQSEPEKVREYLTTIGYEIVAENMVLDEGKYYFALLAKPSDETKSYSKAELCFGPILLASRHAVMKEYLDIQIKKNQELQKALSHIHTEGANDRLEGLLAEAGLLEEALTYYKISDKNNA